MKKALFGVLLVGLTSTLLVGFNTKDYNYHLALEPNTFLLEKLKNNPINDKTSEKYGNQAAKAKLELTFNPDKDPEEDHVEYKIVKTEVHGTVHMTDADYPINGVGEINEVHLDSRLIYFGNIKVQTNNKKGPEEAVLSMRYEPGTDHADVTFTSGDMPNTGLLAFGNLFLTTDEVARIDAILQKDNKK